MTNVLVDWSRNLIQLNEIILANWTVTSKAATKHSRELDGETLQKKLNLTGQVPAIYADQAVKWLRKPATVPEVLGSNSG